jgi:putative Mn2+ efflux pump MntP
MKKDKKIALIIMFIVGLILIMVAIEYDNNTTAEKIRNEREKIEASLEAVKAKDSIQNKKD